MAYRRGRMGRGRKRFFRSRGRRIRPTTEAGTGRRSFERCQFTFGLDQSVASAGNATYNLVVAASGQSMIEPMSVAGSQAAAVARMLQTPLRGIEVLAIQYRCTAHLSPGLMDTSNFHLAPFNGDLYNTTLLVGHDLITQRLDTVADPVAASSSLDSQWPVNQASPSGSNEDVDYALRTHFHDTRILRPVLYFADDGPIAAEGHVAAEFVVRTKLRRRLGDDVGLFFQFANLPNVAASISGNVFWTVSGSLWYRMAW